MSAGAGASDDIRVLAVDDHRLLREALCELLEMYEGLTVVAQADDGPSGVRMAGLHRPDVVLLDVEMPGPGPLANLRGVRQAAPEARIIMLTMHDNRQLIDSLLSAGAVGYLHKEADREVLVSAIRSAMAGGTTMFLPRTPSGSGPERGPAPADTLTLRERELMELVAQGLSNRQIGSRLGITEGTVKRHLRNIFDKLGATSRLDAVNRVQPLRRY
ncbi:two component transcriptional regulator, LuxR family [Streptomyces sp. LamerLS-316]|jgi:DNA-binding NarL/FixJ family response regulator|uniref:Response regulator transcription factor n=2 Tax=Streptomyces TaxID=1883 RepID=A0AAU1LUM6_9ACTN|nr:MULTISPECIES: response regulator transcription factor [unclassified Streptomyces]WSS63161.1 response regulator transcription factor [Streptomyces sp. NBC_01177]WSS70175.1 response regulator transcription factor [Streptomyces sp. NBC_01175]WSS77175.1 response regulator transcription factor [Streptomyces sp. NBC_01174]MDX3056888.1 response regulator transcription factor [Streptomyces sp. NE06-03E]MDX3327577.1 response regulator transcription factor [Streptomyces sp. ME02-6979-3A]